MYREKGEAQTNWFRAHLEDSLQLIDALALAPDAPLLDVGGGRSTLADDLLARGFADVSVLDVSEVALLEARERIGTDAARVHWITGDVTALELPAARYALWHDRAVFHFLVDAHERARYIAAVGRAVRAGGHAVIATFAYDGPERCSGLSVRRYDGIALAEEFAPMFEAVDQGRHVHMTPTGSRQPFTHVVLRRRADV
jgi:SAM-dependent methyltransferase